MGILIAAGSLLPQTAAQIEHLSMNGAARFLLQTRCLLTDADRSAHIQAVSAQAADCLRDGKDVVVHTPNRPEDLREVEKYCAELGISKTEFSRRVSSTLAEITARTLEATH
jgi:uncharacterized protein YgbK (DUF1537 family)